MFYSNLHTSFDSWLTFCEVLLLIYFFINFPLREFYEIYEEKWEYLAVIWNYYEWIIIIFILVVFGIRVQADNYLNGLDLAAPSSQYVDFVRMNFL